MLVTPFPSTSCASFNEHKEKHYPTHTHTQNLIDELTSSSWMLYLSLSCAIGSFPCCNRSTQKAEILIINKVLALHHKRKSHLRTRLGRKRNIRLLDFYANRSSSKTSKIKVYERRTAITIGDDNLYAHVKLAMFLSKLIFPTQALSKKKKQKVRHLLMF